MFASPGKVPRDRQCVLAESFGIFAGKTIMLKSLWSEFKAFAFKGNMVELAVAVVIGGAFGNVINAMVKDIINPAISYAVTGVEEAKDAGLQTVQTVGSKVGAT